MRDDCPGSFLGFKGKSMDAFLYEATVLTDYCEHRYTVVLFYIDMGFKFNSSTGRIDLCL